MQARDQVQRYDGVFSVCKHVSATADVNSFVRNATLEDGDLSEEAHMPHHHVFRAVLDHHDTAEVSIERATPDIVITCSAKW